MCSESKVIDYASLAWDPRSVILRVLQAKSEELFSSALPTTKRVLRDTDFIPTISYTRHCLSYLIS